MFLHIRPMLFYIGRYELRCMVTKDVDICEMSVIVHLTNLNQCPLLLDLTLDDSLITFQAHIE